jgi:hypothetical protein
VKQVPSRTSRTRSRRLYWSIDQYLSQCPRRPAAAPRGPWRGLCRRGVDDEVLRGELDRAAPPPVPGVLAAAPPPPPPPAEPAPVRGLLRPPRAPAGSARAAEGGAAALGAGGAALGTGGCACAPPPRPPARPPVPAWLLVGSTRAGTDAGTGEEMAGTVVGTRWWGVSPRLLEAAEWAGQEGRASSPP